MHIKRLLTVLIGVLLLSSTAALAQDGGSSDESSGQGLTYQGFQLGATLDSVEGKLDEEETEYQSKDHPQLDKVSVVQTKKTLEVGGQEHEFQVQLGFHENKLFDVVFVKQLQQKPDQLKSLQDSLLDKLSNELDAEKPDEPRSISRKNVHVRRFSPSLSGDYGASITANWVTGKRDKVEGDAVRGRLMLRLRNTSTAKIVGKKAREQRKKRRQQMRRKRGGGNTGGGSSGGNSGGGSSGK